MVKRHSNLKDICDGFKNFIQLAHRNGMNAMEITSKLNPTKTDIERFSKGLVKYKDIKLFKTLAPFYLNALILSSREDGEFTLEMRYLNDYNIALNFLGSNLRDKRLAIKGDVNDDLGHSIINSEITVYGNAGYDVGAWAEDSKVYIRGLFKSIASTIRKSSEVHQGEKDGSWIKVYPR